MIPELIDVNATLEEANRARSQFLSTKSHELRTPLASMRGTIKVTSAPGQGSTFTVLLHDILSKPVRTDDLLASLERARTRSVMADLDGEQSHYLHQP